MSFHVAILSSLAPREDVAVSATGFAAPIAVSRASFEEVLARVAPELAVDVPDPHDPRGKPQRIDLRFASMKDFSAASITQASPLLKVLHADGDRNLARTLAAVTEHAAVRALHRAWSGLSFLVRSVAADADVTFTAFAAHPDEVEAAIEKLASSDDPPELFVIDHELRSSRRELDLLSAWAAVSEKWGVSSIATAHPELLGYDDIAKLAKTERRIMSADDPRARGLLHVAAADAARHLTLAMNGGAQVSAAILLASLVAKSVERTGFPCSIVGPHDGKIADLPLREVVDAEGNTESLPLEALVPEAVARDAASAGIALFECVKGTDACVLSRAPALYRGKIDPSGSSPATSATLPEQLFVARIARAVTQLASALPRDTPDAAAKEVAFLALSELFVNVKGRAPELSIAIEKGALHVTVRPKGAFGMRLPEVTLAARLSG